LNNFFGTFFTFLTFEQFDSLVQTATGFNVAEAEAYAQFTGDEGTLQPRPLPMQALDHAAGYLLAFGINAALCNTVTVGPNGQYTLILIHTSHATIGRRVMGGPRISGCGWSVG
jgi:hypothetical protein